MPTSCGLPASRRCTRRAPRPATSSTTSSHDSGDYGMSEVIDIHEGLDGVVAFRTEIAEPDREGGALRYRGIDIEELVGTVPFEQVWGLLVEESLAPGSHRCGARSRAHVQRRRAVRHAKRPCCAQRRVAAREADRHRRRGGDRGSTLAVGGRDLGRGTFGARRRRRAGSVPRQRSTAARHSPSVSCSTGAARGSRRARAIDTYWICTAEHGLTHRPSLRGSSLRPGPTRPPLSASPSARSPARCTAALRHACCRCSTRSNSRGGRANGG